MNLNLSEQEQKEEIINTLFESFYDNGSVNFVVKQDHKKKDRIRKLLEYSYYKGKRFGKLYLSEDGNAAAITIDPTKDKFTFWDLKLIFLVITLTGLRKVLKREKNLKKSKPEEDFVYLWYVGVKVNDQGKGLGTKLIRQIINDYPRKAIHLQTSNELNFPLYERLGFRYDGDCKQDDYYIKIYTHVEHLY